MASVKRQGKGWRAMVSRRGIRRTKVFPTQQEAKDWAARQEYLILNAEDVQAAMPFREVMDRYAREVSPIKRGARWEMIRLEALSRDKIGGIAISELKPADIADWRDRRLKQVKPASVTREMQLMSSVLNTARREWGLIEKNPVSDVKAPPKAPPRDRLPTEDELERLAHAAGEDLTNAIARAFHAFLFAMETAMRAGEICGLTWDRVDLKRRVVRLIHTKNGHPREVPLSSEAVRLIEALPEADPVFGLTSRQLDVLWRKVRDRAQADGLNFHDSRAAAITALSKKLDILELARMVGHRDLRMLQVYYRTPAEDLARRLD
ncbi:tyrosine-type recombinase/integrase [Pontibaca methylaminivorans]|nr:site-specific integrase [Pontibaca methylaminivorans]